MNHVVIPLDESHVVAIDRLVALAGGACRRPERAHITVVAHEGLPVDVAREVLVGAVADLEPFVVHAHGYGLFTGIDPNELSLHVPVVRTPRLDLLHRRVRDALRAAGADVAPWCDADLWSPHITLLDRDLDPRRLGAAVAALAERHHPSWEVLVDRLESWGSGRAPVVPRPPVLLGAQPRMGSTAPNQ